MKFRLLKMNKLSRRVILYLLISWLPLFGFFCFMSPAHALDSPIHVHLTWQSETNTTMTVTWQTTYSDSGDLVLFDNVSHGGAPASYRFNASGSSLTYVGATGYIHVVKLVNLTPDTIYYFICGGSPSEPKGGYSPERAFRTSPSTSRNIRFVAGGDSRTNEAERDIVSQAMAQFNPEFVIHGGDMVENGWSQSQWDTWFTDVDTHWIGTNNLTIPIMPTIGNHEANADNYYFQFALPGNEMWYSYDWGPDIHITCLSTETTTSGAQQIWLENDLKEHANFTWKIVAFHQHTVDGSTSHTGYINAKTDWVPYFDKYHVDLVINGHDHLYMRTVPMNLTHSETEAQTYANGTLYVIAGSWGAPLHTPGSHWYDTYIESIYHFCLIDIFTNRTLHLQAKNDQGITFDEAWIIKPPTTTDDYDGQWHASNFTINLAVKNNFTGNAETYYRINGGPILNVKENGQPSITTEGSNNRLEYWSVGFNNSEELPHNKLTGIKLDKTNPVANAGSNSTIEIGALMKYNGTASTDNVAIKSYTWSFIDITPKIITAANFSYAFSSLGTYQVTLNVSDYAGWWDVATMWVTVVDSSPPTAEFTFNQTVVMGSPIAFNASQSNDNTGIVSYHWNFGDGAPPVTRSEPLINHTFLHPGTFLAILNVTDGVGLWNTVNHSVQVGDPILPIANFSTNQQAVVGEIIVFNASNSSDNGIIVRYAWDFGDGNITVSLSPQISHYYLNEGTYLVNLTVTDEGNNTASSFFSIEIQRVQKPFPGLFIGVLVVGGAALILVTIWGDRQGKMKKDLKGKRSNTFRHLSPLKQYA
jgi:PKD repeat protein